MPFRRTKPNPRRGIAFTVHQPGRVRVEIYGRAELQHVQLPEGSVLIPLNNPADEVALVTLAVTRLADRGRRSVR